MHHRGKIPHNSTANTPLRAFSINFVVSADLKSGHIVRHKLSARTMGQYLELCETISDSKDCPLLSPIVMLPDTADVGTRCFSR